MTSADIERAVQLLRDGGLVAFPTETVYGLGADASSPSALRRLYVVKGRPFEHPVIVHLADVTQLDDWATDVPEAARLLASAFWPGPLTLVLRRTARVIDEVTGGRDTVGVRVPAAPLALELLARFGGGLAAPSANRFGHLSPTTADAVRAELGNDVDAVLDGGPCAVGVESTIVEMTGGDPVLLRPGGVSTERIEAVLGVAVAQAGGPSRAPGMLPSHYAPKALVELVDESVIDERAAELRASGKSVTTLVPSHDLDEDARLLYARLRAADAANTDVVLVVLPPDEGIGVAIRDRLKKAAAPR